MRPARVVEAAADDLGLRLKELADDLAARIGPARVRYGRGRLKRRSPKGFLLDAGSLQLLLPDGRLWSYSRSDSNRFPTGRYFDARAHYRDFAHGRTFLAGAAFTFLGASIGKYTFGFTEQNDDDHPAAASGLCAICGEDRSLRYIDPAAALADIAARAAAPRR